MLFNQQFQLDLVQDQGNEAVRVLEIRAVVAVLLPLLGRPKNVDGVGNQLASDAVRIEGPLKCLVFNRLDNRRRRRPELYMPLVHISPEHFSYQTKM